MGNSDVDLAVGPEGVLYFLALGFDRSVREGTHVTIGVSHDIGATWSFSLLSETRFDDRPWVEVAPDGTAHVIWNDGSGVRHAVSHDKGRTWQELERIHPEGGSSHLAIGPKGEIAVRIVPVSAAGNRFDEGVDLIAVSADGGRSWQKRPAPGQRTWDPTGQDPALPPRWVEPVAWDASGALYSLWSEGRELRLARSVDRGESWHTWSVATETDLAFFPYLAAGPAGELAATWFTSGGGSLAAHVALLIVPEATTQSSRSPGLIHSNRSAGSKRSRRDRSPPRASTCRWPFSPMATSESPRRSTISRGSASASPVACRSPQMSDRDGVSESTLVAESFTGRKPKLLGTWADSGPRYILAHRIRERSRVPGHGHTAGPRRGVQGATRRGRGARGAGTTTA